MGEKKNAWLFLYWGWKVSCWKEVARRLLQILDNEKYSPPPQKHCILLISLKQRKMYVEETADWSSSDDFSTRPWTYKDTFQEWIPALIWDRLPQSCLKDKRKAKPIPEVKQVFFSQTALHMGVYSSMIVFCHICYGPGRTSCAPRFFYNPFNIILLTFFRHLELFLSAHPCTSLSGLCYFFWQKPVKLVQ